MKKAVFAAALAAAVCLPAGAQEYTVGAQANSASGGTGVATVNVNAGDLLNVTVAATDLWSAGALPRWSNADGLVGNLYATGVDESGQPVGTLIGEAFPNLVMNGFSAPYGSLVGNINGNWFLLGTHFSGAAPASGALLLYYWDENSGDNIDSVRAAVSVATVPEPASYALLGVGLLTLAAWRRRQRS
ncbi:MAG: PEP-CTERM sorting domain-containing protein [Telluria sp.]